VQASADTVFDSAAMTSASSGVAAQARPSTCIHTPVRFRSQSDRRRLPQRRESNMSAKEHKGGSHHELAAEHHETAAHHHREAANITDTAITRRSAITPTWRMRMDCMRPIMGKRPRNTTRSTTKKKNKNAKRLFSGIWPSAARSTRVPLLSTYRDDGLEAHAAPIPAIGCRGALALCFCVTSFHFD
jgi:hypothetical protein